MHLFRSARGRVPGIHHLARSAHPAPHDCRGPRKPLARGLDSHLLRGREPHLGENVQDGQYASSSGVRGRAGIRVILHHVSRLGHGERAGLAV